MVVSLEMHAVCQQPAAAAEQHINAAIIVSTTIFKDAVCTDVGEMDQAAGAANTITKVAEEKCSGVPAWLQTATATATIQTSSQAQRQRNIIGTIFTKCAEVVQQEEV